MTTIFSEMLIQLRKDAGFSSAYQFYHANDGKNVLKMTYRNYLLIEQGEALPPIEKLGVLIWSLRIPHGSAEANAFVYAWLRSMAGEENFKTLLEPITTVKPDSMGSSPLQNAMKKSLDKTRYYLTLEQVKAIHSSDDNYLCFLAISSDKGVWKVKEFADRLKLPEAAAKKALKTLAGLKLVKEIKKDVYKCSLADALLTYPNMNTLPPDFGKKLRACNRKLLETGQEIYPHSIIVRANDNDFRSYIQILGTSLSTAATYAVTEKSDKTALFMVDAKISKLRDF